MSAPVRVGADTGVVGFSGVEVMVRVAHGLEVTFAIATTRKDAELIVRAVNAHDDLVAAAEQLRSWCIPGMNWTDDTGQALLAQMDAALAKARGEPS